MNKDEVTEMTLYSHAMMAMTSIHHVYGAMIYETPWRLHVLMVSVPVIIVTYLLNRWRTRKTGSSLKLLVIVLAVLTFIFSISLIGLFEGLYNHAVKDVLFYGSADQSLLLKLFPPPKYVMPDDFIFEFTGVLQAVILMPLIVSLVRVIKLQLKNQL